MSFSSWNYLEEFRMPNIFVLLMIISTIASIVLMSYSITQHQTKNSFYLIFLSIATFFFSFGYLLEIVALTKEAAFYGVGVQKMGVAYLCPLAYLFIRDMYKEKRFSSIKTFLIFLVPILTMVAFYGYPYITLYYKGIEYIHNGYIANCKGIPGPLYHVGNIYNYIFFFLGIKLIVGHLRKARGRERTRCYISLSAYIVPTVSAIIFHVLNHKILFDPNPFAYGISIVILLIQIKGYNPLNIVPFAREQVIEEMEDAFVVCDNFFNFLDANAAARRLFPQLNSIMIGETIKKVEGFKTEGEFYITENDELRIYKISQSPIFRSGKYSGICFLLHDITEEDKLLKKLHVQATMDPLLDIYNRGAFFNIVRPILDTDKNSETYTMLMIDIDYFKKVNDTYGHLCGDEVLKAVASIVKNNISEDDIIGRYGGEELIALLRNIPSKHIIDVIEKLRRTIEETTIFCKENGVNVTVSIGAAHALLEEGYSLETMLYQSDKALYYAKDNGRNRTCLYDVALFH